MMGLETVRQASVKAAPVNAGAGWLGSKDRADPAVEPTMLIKRCPGCRSFNVRLSSFYGASEAALFGALSPYRCNDCHTFFRVVSREFRVGVAVILSIVVTSVVVALLFGGYP